MPQIISMFSENLCKHVEYMFLSSKKRTGVWFSRYGNLDQSFISIGRENIDKSAASDEYIPGIRQKNSSEKAKQSDLVRPAR